MMRHTHRFIVESSGQTRKCTLCGRRQEKHTKYEDTAGPRGFKRVAGYRWKTISINT